MRLWRAHGLGNDYLVLEDGPAMTPELARAICDRHRGVGGDGVLEPTDAPDADHGVRIWNPDGSVAEKSGNGLRIYARWLVARAGASTAFTVSTGTERVSCEVGDEVRVAMGRARFAPADVPVASASPFVERPIALDGATLTATAVGIGNPHCVIYREEPLDTLPWRDWGRRLEVHPLFPNRTNVQVARVRGPRTVEARIWERGAGETLASGSSSCAVAAVGVRTGRLHDGEIEVRMPGGSLHVRVDPDGELHLRGPVEPVGLVEVDPAWLAARAG